MIGAGPGLSSERDYEVGDCFLYSSIWLSCRGGIVNGGRENWIWKESAVETVDRRSEWACGEKVS